MSLRLGPTAAAVSFHARIVEYLESVYDVALGAGHTQRIMEALTRPPSITTLRCNIARASREAIIALLHERLREPCERRGRPVPSISPHPLLDDVIVIPCIGPRDVVPEEREVIVGADCAMAVLRGAEVYSAGIIGSSFVNVGKPCSVWADIDASCKHGTVHFDGRKMFVGNGTCVIPRTTLFASDKPPKGIAVSMTDPLYDSPSLDHVLPDLLHAQNLPSCLVAHALDVKPGMRVLDMCAAPGGKTSHVAARMGDVGTVEALDRASNRVALLKKTITAAGLTCVNVRKLDATKAPDVFAHSSFDRVILDAPCSGLGQRPCLSSKLTLEEIVEYGLNQRTLFAAAMRVLRPGGVLVYSTCTINPQFADVQFASRPDIAAVRMRKLLAGPSANTPTSGLLPLTPSSVTLGCTEPGCPTASAPSSRDSTRPHRTSALASSSPSSSRPDSHAVGWGWR